MAIWELLLRSQAPTVLLPLSRAHTDLALLSWRFDRQELVQVDLASDAELRRIRRDLESLGAAVRRCETLGTLRILLLDLPASGPDDLWSGALDHGLIQAPPTLYYNGWGYYRLIGFGEPDLKSFVRGLRSVGPTELYGKHLVPLSTLLSSVTSDQVVGAMTLLQTETILRAVDGGYFQTPRRVKASDLARAAGVGRTTFEEHLRKAEHHLIEALVPLLRIHLTQTAPARHVPDLLAAWGIPPSPAERGARRTRAAPTIEARTS